ncbi:MAG: ribonuclease P protein component [Legionellales bacterium RIFCSPHIGHO2_12_FULL_35_11]|nr:MAG: ribonuclease P protein component [Legionellales bacterium RIFCSPHIGHO2_12_FULL_35_11]
MNNFSKSQRLLTKIDFDFVFSRAKKISTKYFVVLYRDNKISHSRLGIILAKKMVPKAHDRNKIKRLIRESFRTNKIKPVDIVFLARPGLAKITNHEFISSIEQAWSKI